MARFNNIQDVVNAIGEGFKSWFKQTPDKSSVNTNAPSFSEKEDTDAFRDLVLRKKLINRFGLDSDTFNTAMNNFNEKSPFLSRKSNQQTNGELIDSNLPKNAPILQNYFKKENDFWSKIDPDVLKVVRTIGASKRDRPPENSEEERQWFWEDIQADKARKEAAIQLNSLKQKYPYLTPLQLYYYYQIWMPQGDSWRAANIENYLPLLSKPTAKLKNEIASKLSDTAKSAKDKIDFKPKIGITDEAKQKFRDVARPDWLTGYRGELGSEKRWNERMNQINEYNKAIDSQVNAAKTLLESLNKPETMESIASAINSGVVWDTVKFIHNLYPQVDVSNVYNQLNSVISKDREFLSQVQNALKSVFKLDIDMLGWLKSYGV